MLYLSHSYFYVAGEPGARFGLTPSGDGEGGYSEWLHAMRLVARLPAGVPQHFRKKVRNRRLKLGFDETGTVKTTVYNDALWLDQAALARSPRSIES